MRTAPRLVAALASSLPRVGALDGLLVADFSRVLAGPLATMTLGDLGADVRRPPPRLDEHGDELRAWLRGAT